MGTSVGARREAVVSEPPARWHVASLDGVRALSIASVIGGHVLIFDTPRGGYLGGAMAAYGVSVFFVLSGFLITSLLLQEERRTGHVDITGFYGRRFLRIFPAYFAYIATIWALDRTRLIEHVTTHDYLASALFARNLTGHAHETTHLWSLSLEEQFYLVWPATFAFLPKRRRVGVTSAALVLFALWRTIVVFKGWYAFGALYLRTDLRLDTILSGCVLALLGTEAVNRRVAKFGSLLPTALAALATGLAVARAILDRPVVATVGYSVDALAIVLFVSLATSPATSLEKFLSLPSLGYVGRISYSLYLWQQLFLAPGESGSLFGLRRFPWNIVATFAVASCSYFGIERPIVQWKNRWARKRADAQAFRPPTDH